MGEFSLNTDILVIGAICVLIGVVFAIILSMKGASKRRANQIIAQIDRDARTIAIIEEEVENTAGADFCKFFLVLAVPFFLFAILLDNSAIRGAMYAALLIAAAVIFGLGIITGKKRIYVVLRPTHAGSAADGAGSIAK